MERPLATSWIRVLLVTLATGIPVHAQHAGYGGQGPPGQKGSTDAQGQPSPNQVPGQGLNQGQDQGSSQGPGTTHFRPIVPHWRAYPPLQSGSHFQAPGRFYTFTWIDSASHHSGMTLAPADAALRAHLKLSKDEGLIVTALEPGSPAAAAGIRQNDVLTRLYTDPDGPIKLSKPEDLEAGLKKTAGDQPPVFLLLLRDGKKCTIGVQPHIKVSLGPVQPKPSTYWLGVSVAPIEPALRAQLQLPERQGLITLDVVKDGPAAKAGVRQYDILLKFDGADLTDQAVLTKLAQQRGEKAVALELIREGRKQEVTITPERRKLVPGTLQFHEPRTGQLDVVLPGAVVSEQPTPLNEVVSLFDYSADGRLMYAPNLAADGQKPSGRDEKSANSEDSTTKRLDQLSSQIQELRKAIEALAKPRDKE